MKVGKDLEKFPLEYTKPLIFCFKVFAKCNIYFLEGETSLLTRFLRFLSVVPLVIFVLTCMTANYVTKMSTNNLTTSDLGMKVAAYIYCLEAFFNALILVPKTSKIKIFVTDLGKIWRTSDLNKKQIEKKNRLLKWINTLHKYVYSLYMATVYSNMLTPVAAVFFIRHVLKRECEPQLILGSAYPHDPSASLHSYLLTYLCECYMLYLSTNMNLITDIFMITLCTYLGIGFALLREDLIHICPETDNNNISNDTYTKCMQKFVKRHQKLLLLSKLLDEIYNHVIFVKLLTFIFILCFIGFSILWATTTYDMINFGLGLVSFLMPLYLICYHSEMLQQESGGIADAAYESLWYKGGASHGKVICFIIMRAQQPCYLTSLNIVPITMNTFAKVLSNSWSYFSIINSFYSEEN